MDNTQLLDEFFTISRLMKEHMAYDARFFHLTMLQLQTLVYVKQRPYCQMSEIANHFAIELPSATSLITTIKKAKLIERKTDPKDRRVVQIILTKAGDELLSDALKERKKKMTHMLQLLTTEEKKSLSSIIQKLIMRMEKKNEK